ncbi:MAG: type II CAAX endopeptidase family protein [Verrucomicrobia bacterium]|nr:type II CAAX endopeptidase family protein [Verrucomicrobiota bacterium]
MLLFVVLAFAGGWLVASPLWLSGLGLKHPMTIVLLQAMMFVPGAATLLLAFWLRPETEKVRLMGLGLGSKGWWRYWLFGWLVVPCFAMAAPFVSAAFGLCTLDLREFSGFQKLLQSSGGGAALNIMPVQALVARQMVGGLFVSVLSAPFALGEEIGWRGYLLPKLLPLGQWPALLLSGALWGLWHAPVILLGYNYPKHPVLGVFAMTAFCVILGILFGWTRLATGSIWPAVIGHGALNGSAGAMLLFSKAGTSFDALHAGITGWSGWLLPAVWILMLLATRRLPVAGCPDAETVGDQERKTGPETTHTEN